MAKQIGKKERMVRQFFTEHHAGEVPIDETVQNLYKQFMLNTENSDVSYGLFNGVVKKLRAGFVPGAQRTSTSSPEPGNAENSSVNVEPPEIIKIGNMPFPNFKLFKTNSLIDKILSDHTVDGGLYSGTANILVGESGVGKSTVTLQMLAKIKEVNSEAKILNISSEMTRNDLFFFYSKMPIIGNVPTLLLMDHIQGRFDLTLKNALLSDEYDVILIDSYQDIVVKMADVLGFKTTRASTWLTNLIIEAADKLGKAVIAIQHLTKGGQYVGSTYLKHATTAMMEMRFDDSGRRYIEFSKNRRGGSQINKRVYYSLVEGEVVWDEESWNRDREADILANGEQESRSELENRFNELFLRVNEHSAEDVIEDVEDAEVETITITN